MTIKIRLSTLLLYKVSVLITIDCKKYLCWISGHMEITVHEVAAAAKGYSVILYSILFKPLNIY